MVAKTTATWIRVTETTSDHTPDEEPELRVPAGTTITAPKRPAIAVRSGDAGWREPREIYAYTYEGTDEFTRVSAGVIHLYAGEGGGGGGGGGRSGVRMDDLPPIDEPQLSWIDGVQITADVVGVFDPTPSADGVSGVISVFRGDLGGAGLAVAAMVPYLGDMVAKPVKVARQIVRQFPHLARLLETAGGIDGLFSILRRRPQRSVEILRTLNRMHGRAEQLYGVRNFLSEARRLQLPTDGPIVFVPKRNWDPTRARPGQGIEDYFGNVWTRGPSRTAGEPFEWDVTPGPGSNGLGALARGGTHVNVSLTGRVTH